jgi:ketosteroid isomerase-like protein|tara:strand:- start:406 stop:867 length:462 start_codon:yes stop_codon:yes gene_type:complete
MIDTEQFTLVLRKFTDAVEAGDGSALSALFTPDGIYCDGFYGEFIGREAIAKMLEEHFWGHAEGFRWIMMDPVVGENIGYVRYRFSYRSKLPGVVGEQVVFEGMSQFSFLEDEIQYYREEFNTGIAVSQLKFTPDRIAKHLAKRAQSVRSRAK